MTANNLLDELKSELAILFSDYTLPNKNGVLQLVKIFTQYIPLPSSITLTDKLTGIKNYESNDYEANFPSIIIRHEGLIDNEERRLEMSTHKIKLLFGIYDDAVECQGWRDLFSMIEVVRQYFLVNRILSGKYRLNMPLDTHLLDADSWPVYFAEMNMTFESGRALQPALFVHRRNEQLAGKKRE